MDSTISVKSTGGGSFSVVPGGWVDTTVITSDGCTRYPGMHNGNLSATVVVVVADETRIEEVSDYVEETNNGVSDVSDEATVCHESLVYIAGPGAKGVAIRVMVFACNHCDHKCIDPGMVESSRSRGANCGTSILFGSDE